MIPGKVFFQSIDISEHFNKKYEVYLLMNGIFYDKIKPFQTKYLCLTANDLLQVELGIKNYQSQKENQDVLAESKPLKDKKQVQNIPTVIKNLPSQYLKVQIPQAYKLVLESKTIDLKFQLNSKNNNEQIKIHFLFQPVSSFSRKKLGATLTSNKTTIKNPSNFNATSQRLNLFQRRQNNHDTFRQNSFSNSPKQYFPQKIDYAKERRSRSKSPASIQDQTFIDRKYNDRIGLSKTMDNKKDFFRQKMNEYQNATKEISQSSKINRKFNYVPQDIIIEDDSLNSRRYFNSGKRSVSPQNIQQPQLSYKVDAMKRIIDPLPHFNQGMNLQMLSDIMQNQTYTSRGNQLFQVSQQKNTVQKNSEEAIKIPGNTQNYHTQANLRLFQSVSEHDTLQALAYQREKILGELFGKLGTRNKK